MVLKKKKKYIYNLLNDSFLIKLLKFANLYNKLILNMSNISKTIDILWIPRYLMFKFICNLNILMFGCTLY